jgi:hypothetical protein
MKRIAYVLGIAATFALTAVAGAQTDTWTEYIYGDDGFAMSAPVEPKLATQPIYVVGGTADAHIYTVLEEPSTAFMLFIFERHRNDRRTTSQLRAQSRQWALSSVNGKLLDESELTLGTARGTQLTFEAQHPDHDAKTHQVRTRYYVVGRKVYNLIAIAPIGEPFPADAERWFKGFRLTGSSNQ